MTVPGNGIVVQDGRLVILCGKTAVPISYLDKNGEKIAADQYQHMFAREHIKEEEKDARTRTPQSNR